MTQFEVLVTGGETRQGIVTIRSLARRGVSMLVVGEHPRSVAKYSKYVTHFEHVSSAIDAPDLFLERVRDLVKLHNVPYVYPVTESSLVPLNAHRTELCCAGLIAPHSDVVRQGLDKKLTLAAAERAGVFPSRTRYPRSIDEAESTAVEWGFPIIFKPQGRSNDATIEGKFDFKVAYAHDVRELRSFLMSLGDGPLPMMQDYAYGPHTQFCCFFENGEPHSHFQDLAIRTHPISGGVGARMETRPIDPDVQEMSIRVFREMNWDGVGQAQYKGPAPDGSFRFIEVSVRLPASVGSAVTSGIDYPWMQYCHYAGRPVERATTHRAGVATRWFKGDTLAVATHLAGLTPHSADPLPTKSQALWGYVLDAFRPGLRHYVLSWRDPWPGLMEMLDTVPHVWTVLRSLLARCIPKSLRRRR